MNCVVGGIAYSVVAIKIGDLGASLTSLSTAMIYSPEEVASSSGGMSAGKYFYQFYRPIVSGTLTGTNP